MDDATAIDGLLPSAMLAEVESLAAAEHRPVGEVVREAVAIYLRDRRPPSDTSTKLTPQEAAARMLELRKGNTLPEGVTIRDLMEYGRA